MSSCDLRPELDGQDQVQILRDSSTNLLTSTNDHMIRPYMGCLMQFSLYRHTKKSYKIQIFFRRKSVFLPSNLL
jgi:hypothetical protein